MAKYRVHLRPIVRVCLEVEAESPKAAVLKATNFNYNPWKLFPEDRNPDYPSTCEPGRIFVAGYNEEMGRACLVDEFDEGNSSYIYEESEWRSSTTGNRLRKNARDDIVYG